MLLRFDLLFWNKRNRIGYQEEDSMLSMMKGGKVFPVTKVSRTQEYRRMKAKISQVDFDAVWDFLESDINEDVFSCGTKYSQANQEAWRGPLSKLFSAVGKDVVATGYFLGLIVMDLLISYDEQWVCAKTNITKRKFETMCYWRQK